MKQNLLNLKSWLLMMCLLFGVGASWAADADYTLTPSAGSNNSYTGNCDVTVGGITWNVAGNAQQVPWRLGGKSITKVDRTVYSKTAYTSAVSKIDLTVGAASSITVNSLKLVYSTNSDFSNSSEISKTFTASSTISFEGEFPANAYYKFVFNVTVSGTSNKFVEFSKVEFYNKTDGGTTTEPTKYDVAIANDIANGSVTADKETAAEGDDVTLTATPATGYEFGSWNVTNASSAAITVTNNKFKMPAANVNVSATFKKSRPENEIFYESFDNCGGSGGNDGLWSGNIASSQLKADMCDNHNPDWQINTGYAANKCVRLGTGSALGTMETPGINATGNLTLTFKAGAWSEKSKYLKLSATGATLDKSSVTMTDASFTEFTVNITNATTGFKIKFSGNAASNSQFFLDEVSIVKAGAQEIQNLIKTTSADLYVDDEIEDLKTYLSLPSDYTGTVTFSSEQNGTLVTIVGEQLSADAAGTATINVTASAVDGKYLETTGTITLNISKKTPALSWDESKTSYTIFNLADNNNNNFVGQTATATNGGAVKYSIAGTGATIDTDGLVAITGVGESTITAYTEETDALNAAESITYTLTIVEPSITITPEDGIVSFDNPVVTVTANGISGSLLNYETEEETNFDGKSTSSSFNTGGNLGVSIKDEAGNSYEKEFTIKVLKDAALQFSASELRVLVGSEDFVEPTLTKATDAEVTYSLVYEKEESIDKVATIDPATGKLTLKKLSTETQGAVTVKATTPATDEYTAGEATYELVVYRNVPTFTWSEESVTIDKDELDKLPTPIVQDDRNVTSLTSSNTDVAAIVDGAITFIGYGTTTITGKTYATWDYAPATASYELTFAPKYTVTFSVDGDETVVREETTGAGVTAPTVEAVGSYTFDGWTTAEVDPESTSKPSLVSLSEGKYMPTENITLYAVYKRVEEGEGGSSDEGEFLIYADVNGTKYYMTGKPMASGQTVNQVLSSTNRDEATTFTIAKKEGSENQYSISYDDNGTTKYLYHNASGNYLQDRTDEYFFTFSNGAKTGTTRILNGRAIAFRAGNSYNIFKIFATTNITAESAEYYDPTLEQISSGSTAYYTTSPSYPITIGQYEYATLVVPCNLDFTGTGVKAYSISALNGSNAIAAEQAKVPANKPIIVHGAQGTHKIPRVSEAADFETMLQAKDEVLYDSDGDEFDYFYLGVNNGNVCFKKLTSGSLAAGKCFIPVAKEANIKIISLVIDDEDATGISSVENMKMNNGAVYNLAGQRVDANTKGIIIVNGKKMFNK